MGGNEGQEAEEVEKYKTERGGRKGTRAGKESYRRKRPTRSIYLQKNHL